MPSGWKVNSGSPAPPVEMTQEEYDKAVGSGTVAPFPVKIVEKHTVSPAFDETSPAYDERPVERRIWRAKKILEVFGALAPDRKIYLQSLDENLATERMPSVYDTGPVWSPSGSGQVEFSPERTDRAEIDKDGRLYFWFTNGMQIRIDPNVVDWHEFTIEVHHSGGAKAIEALEGPTT